MSLYEGAVKRPIMTSLCFAAIMILGLFSLVQLPIDLYPDIDTNTIMVLTYYNGASAEDIENDYFHFNWGWSGRDNAFCAIGALNTTKYAFNSSNNAIIDLYPQTENYNHRPYYLYHHRPLEGYENASLSSHGISLIPVMSFLS